MCKMLSTAIDETFQINPKHNCDDKCLIYLLKCSVMYEKQRMHFNLGGITTRKMTKSFKETKIEY